MKENQRIYVKGDTKRYDEVIKLLKDLGGRNILHLQGYISDAYYFINPDGIIDSAIPYRSGAFPFIKEFYKEISLPRWKPKYNEGYYCMNLVGEIIYNIWYGSRDDELCYKFGNCFRTPEEAEEASNKIKRVLNNK